MSHPELHFYVLCISAKIICQDSFPRALENIVCLRGNMNYNRRSVPMHKAMVFRTYNFTIQNKIESVAVCTESIRTSQHLSFIPQRIPSRSINHIYQVHIHTLSHLLVHYKWIQHYSNAKDQQLSQGLKYRQVAERKGNLRSSLTTLQNDESADYLFGFPLSFAASP